MPKKGFFPFHLIVLKRNIQVKGSCFHFIGVKFQPCINFEKNIQREFQLSTFPFWELPTLQVLWCFFSILNGHLMFMNDILFNQKNDLVANIQEWEGPCFYNNAFLRKEKKVTLNMYEKNHQKKICLLQLVLCNM